ncbi:hypothetical protein D3C73_1413940 [compost metagenome]
MAWYLKGLRGAARIKDAIMEQTRRDDMVMLLDRFVEQMNDSGDEEGAAPDEITVSYH